MQRKQKIFVLLLSRTYLTALGYNSLAKQSATIKNKGLSITSYNKHSPFRLQKNKVISNMTYTTNEEDQKEVAKLKERLSKVNESASEHASKSDEDLLSQGSNPSWLVPNVSIDEGAHKYVLISATEPSIRSTGQSPLSQYFVVSKRGASYHCNAAEPFVNILEANGYTQIDVTGGGRILLDNDEKRISIFGYSYGFGLADHCISKAVIEDDKRFEGYDVTWSNDGY